MSTDSADLSESVVSVEVAESVAILNEADDPAEDSADSADSAEEADDDSTDDSADDEA